jgi:antitoxin component of MazEF toxin-antitoxin module
MPFEPKVKLRKVGNSFTITIPADMIEDLAWREGDIVRVGLERRYSSRRLRRWEIDYS